MNCFHSNPFVLLILLLALIFSGTGCFNGHKRSDFERPQSRIFRYALRGSPSTLDPALATDLETANLHHQVLEGLVGWNEKSEIVPKIAKRWEIREGGRIYLFYLNQNIRFSNGNLLTADDVKWSLERNCSSILASPIAEHYLGDIQGVKDRLLGKSNVISGVEVVDSFLIKIKLERPRPFFLQKLTHPVAAVLDHRSVPFNHEIVFPHQLISVAPFKMEAFFPEQLIQLHSNPYYHGGEAKIKRIDILIIKDALSCLNKYKSGDLDMTYVQSLEVSKLQKDQKFSKDLQIFPSPSLTYLALNSQIYEPFKEKKVRRAFAMSINREAIVREVLGGVYMPAYSLIPPFIVGHRSHTRVPAFNPLEARKLLEEAGFSKPGKMPPLSLYLIEKSPSALRCAEAVAIQLRQNLGVPVSLKTMELSSLYRLRSEKKLGFILATWMPTFLDPENFLDTLLYSKSTLNCCSYVNKKFDALLDEARENQDPEKRLKIFAQAEDMALWDASLLPLYFFRDIELVHPRVKHLERSLFGHLPFSRLELEQH